MPQPQSPKGTDLFNHLKGTDLFGKPNKSVPFSPREAHCTAVKRASTLDNGYRGLGNALFYARLGLPLSLLFGVVYFGTNWITSRRTDTHRLYLEWELAIPFVPGMIYVYASLLVLLLVPAFILTRAELTALARALVAALFTAAAVYLLLPAELGFVRPEQVPGHDALFQALYALEMPHNLVPSLHVAASILLIAALWRSLPPVWIRTGLVLWGLLLCASVLLVHQHHLLDMATGLLLGYLCYRLVYWRAIAGH
jgi:membrane-associated phospholipid phosphatase